MFELYLHDAYGFFEIAQREEDDLLARRYYRSGIFSVTSAMEAYVNYIGDSFSKADTLTDHERAFLNDKQLIFDPLKAKLVEQTKYYSIEDKIKFIFRKFIHSEDIGSNTAWSDYIVVKKLRDGLIHPREFEDSVDISEYRKKLSRGLFGTIKLMNQMSKGIFKRELRRKLLDLIPE